VSSADVHAGVRARHGVPRVWRELTEAVTAADSDKIDDRWFDLLREMGVFRSLLPAELAGAGLGPPEAMDLVEELATLSGNVGWISFVGLTGGIFATELPLDLARVIYADPDALVAYAGAANGRLDKDGDGYVLTGHWEAASGLSRAAWVAVGCRMPDGDHHSRNSPGTAVAFVPRADCDASYAWKPVGLSGTGTGSLRIDGAAVAAEQLLPDPGRDAADYWRKRRGRLLIPSLMACVSLGLARAAIGEVVGQFASESDGRPGGRRADSEHVQHALGRLHADVRSARAFLREVTVDCWQRATAGEDLSLEQGALHRLAATHAAVVAAEASAAAAALIGVRGVTPSHAVCRHWIDARTVAANVTVRDLYYRVYGGAAMGGAIPQSWP